MKAPFLALLALTLPFTASAADRHLGDVYDVHCQSVFEGKATTRVERISLEQGKDEDGLDTIKSMTLRVHHQIGNDIYPQRFEVTGSEIDTNKDLVSVRAVNRKGQKMLLEIPYGEDASIDADGYRESSLLINGKPQDYLKLECRMVIAS